MSDTRLADKLAEMIADLDAHIERRAQQIADPRIAEALEAHETALNNVMATAAAQEQRLFDLVAELRRQVDAQVRRAERAEAKAQEARE